MRPALAVLLILAPVAIAADPPKAAPVTPLDTAWKDLLSTDDAKATSAALTLATLPKDEVVVFLGKNLRAVKADKKLLNRLLNDLGDKEPALYEPAVEELAYFGRYIKEELKAEAKDAGNPLVKERAAKLVADIEAREQAEKKVEEVKKEEEAPVVGGRGASVAIRNGQVFINGKPVSAEAKTVVIERPGPPAGWVRAARSIAVLEHINTPEAVKVLEQMALGEDSAPPTKQAQDALARLKRKK